MIFLPGLALFASYLGGIGTDEIRRIAIAGDGSIWAAGRTTSDDFPKVKALPMPGPTPRTCSVGGGLFPATYPCPIATSFLARYDASGQTLLWSTWFETINDLKAGPSGDLYLAGSTAPANLPATPGAWKTQTTQTRTGFLARMRPDGTRVFVTFTDTEPVAVAVDSAGNVYAAASTNGDIVVTKFDANGAALVYTKTMGGSSTDSPAALGVDTAGGVIVVGTTSSDNFPTTPGSLEPARPAGSGDTSFVVRLGNGGAVLYSTYFSTSAIKGLAVTPAGEAWLAGSATSTQYLLAKLDAGGTRVLVTRTATGWAEAIALDPSGNVLLSGETTARLFPATPDAAQRQFRGGTGCSLDYFNNTLCTSFNDGFLAQYGPTGELLYASYFGGGNHDGATALAAAASGRVLLGGWTRSADLPYGDVSANEGFSAATCKSVSLGPSGPRDYHYSEWPCEDAFLAAIDISAGALQLTNAASFSAETVVPGTLVSLFGTALGPEAGREFQLTAAGLVPTTVAGTRVLFDGVPGPVLYAQARQVNAVTPYSMAGRTKVRVEVESGGRIVAGGVWRTAATAPALFTIDSSGAGEVAALNEDGSINSKDNPARRGSIVSLFATGAGLGDPEQADGQPAQPPYSRPRLGTGVLFERPTVSSGIRYTGGFVLGEILYTGAAPTLVAGVLQVNVRIPEAAESGPAVPLLLTVGDRVSPMGTTIAVKD